MNVLITGAAGFIGSHLADRYTAHGDLVVGVDNMSTGSSVNADGSWNLRVLDIRDRHALYVVANELRPDLVFHCAASYSDPDLWHRDAETNVAGSINVALVARHHSPQLVYFQTALPPVSSYAISKHAGLAYLELSGVPLLTLRLANVYGPRNLSGAIPSFYKRLSAGEPCTVVDTRRDAVYIDDLIRLVERAVELEAVGTYDACSGRSYPIRAYYDAVADALEIDTEPQEMPRSEDDLEEMTLDPEETASRFGWRAETPLAEGIAETIAWYREHGVAETYTHLVKT